jgi:hypothetical protein
MREHFTGDHPDKAAKFPPPVKWRRGRQAMALSIVTAVFCLYVPARTGPLKPSSRSAIGTINVDGVVHVDGSPVMLGQTLFSGCRIRTSPATECILELGNLARLKLEAETSATLEASEQNLSAALNNGGMHVAVPQGIAAIITTADASITTDARQFVAFRVIADSCSTTVSVQSGRVEIHSLHNLRSSVSAGESFSTGTAALPSVPPQDFNKRKRVALLMAVGGAVAILILALQGEEPEEEFGGSVIVPSGSVR